MAVIVDDKRGRITSRNVQVNMYGKTETRYFVSCRMKNGRGYYAPEQMNRLGQALALLNGEA